MSDKNITSEDKNSPCAIGQSQISFNYDTARDLPPSHFSVATQSRLNHLSSVYF